MFCNQKFPSCFSLTEPGITQSMCKNYKSCMVKFLFSVNRWYKVGKGKGGTTGFGSMYHEVMDKTYTGVKNGDGLPVRKDVGKWIDKYIRDNRDELSGCKDEQLEVDALTIELMVEQYLKYYKNDFTKARIDFVEQTLRVRWHGVDLRCKIDLGLGFNNSNNTMDHKTMSRVYEDALVKQLSFDFQHLFYGVCVEEEYKIKINGAYHNIIKRPEIKFTTFKEYENLLSRDLAKRPDFYFRRFIISYTEKDKENFRNELDSLFEDINNVLAGKKKIYKNEQSCNIFSQCYFLDACSSGSLVGYEQHNKPYYGELGGSNGKGSQEKVSCRSIKRGR